MISSAKRMKNARSTSAPVGTVLQWLGLALVFLIPLLCGWQIVWALKRGKIVAPYSHNSVLFSLQESAGSFWTVIGFYAAVGIVTALISARLLKGLWKHRGTNQNA